MYKITWTKRAAKQLRKVPSDYIELIYVSVGELAHWPEAAKKLDIRQLKSHRYGYRLRVGRYRVFFDIQAKMEVMSIEQVRKRDERTY